jgi:seryl-tRNA synthetase
MIDMKYFREHSDQIAQSAANKGVTIDVAEILTLDESVRAQQQAVEAAKAKKNAASALIAKASPDDRAKLIEEMRAFDTESADVAENFAEQQKKLEYLLRRIPNPALPDVKVGKDESENEILAVVGTKPEFSFTPKDHLALGEGLDIIDVERGTKAAESRFAYIKGDGARLQLALTNYAVTVASKHGFIPMFVPDMVNEKTMSAMGYLEHGGENEIYKLANDDLYMIGTAEQPLGAYHADEIIDVTTPIRYVGISACFRREAGSYGKDTRGILRMHQFDKIEMFSFTKPEVSNEEHMLLRSIEEELMQGLGLHYQVIKQCTGDLGLPAARKFDIETWIPSQNTFRETHSTSTCTDFQSRRLNTRYRKEDGSLAFVHALNGTAFAIGRTMIAILENYQNEDGSVTIPEVLRPYMGGQATVVKRG